MNLIGVVEVPMGSIYKYELDIEKDSGKLVLERVLSMRYPTNYGFILNTIGEDGDALDIFIYSEDPLVPLSEVKLDVLGVIEITDEGIKDEKIICGINSSIHPVEASFNKVRYFLMNYKKDVLITNVGNQEQALQLINEARDRYEKRK